MKTFRRIAVFFGLLYGHAAYALGPIDGEVGLTGWVVGDYQEASFNSPLTSAYGELWLNERWGVRGALYRINEDSVSMAPDEQTFIDFKYRLLSSGGTFVGLGLGWEQNRFGAEGSLSGPRLMAEARLDMMGFLRLYTEIGWAPSLGDIGSRRDVSSVAAEAGLVLDPFPFFDIRLGWRYQIAEYLGALTGSKASEANYGLILGAGFHW